MSAQELQQAAAILRIRATAATQPKAMHPWGDKTLPSLHPDMHAQEVNAYLGGTWGTYYATMHPGVGFALADWLDAEAAMYDRLEEIKIKVTAKGGTMSWGDSTQEQAEAVARAILGGN